MIPEMPALIPANAFIPNTMAREVSPPNSPPPLNVPSDASLHRDLDDQIQLVKQIQKILGTEQSKLEMLLAEFHARSSKRKHGLQAMLHPVADRPSCQPKHKKVSSPESINKHQGEPHHREKDQGAPKQENLLEAEIPVEIVETEKVPSRERHEMVRFRNFWSSCGDLLKDEDIDIKEELNCVVIEDLVVEELEKGRKLDRTK